MKRNGGTFMKGLDAQLGKLDFNLKVFFFLLFLCMAISFVSNIAKKSWLFSCWPLSCHFFFLQIAVRGHFPSENLSLFLILQWLELLTRLLSVPTTSSPLLPNTLHGSSLWQLSSSVNYSLLRPDSMSHTAWYIYEIEHLAVCFACSRPVHICCVE